MTDLEREVVPINSDDDDWIPVSNRRMLRSTMAAIMASPCEGNDRDVEMCFRMIGDGGRNYWMFITIPGIATTLKRLSRVGPGSFNHEHNIDEAADALPSNYDILQNRFRLVSACDQLKGPFPSPSPYFTLAVSSAVLDSTVYCLGGDPNDIPDSSQDIFGQTSQSNQYQDYASIVADILSRNLKPPEAGDGICHNIYTLNVLDPFSGWRKGKRLISHRLTPHLVSYQGLLYAFSGNTPGQAFAEVYDTVSHVWTRLPPPPFGWLPDTKFCVVPLKHWNKLWVLDRNSEVNYTYDVTTGLWEEREDMPNVHILAVRFPLTSALSRENHMVVYGIDHDQVIYAYNLSNKLSFKGSISGGHQSQNHMSSYHMHRNFFPRRLHHLHRDFFFLISCDNQLDNVCVKSLLHVTLIQISLMAPNNSTKYSHYQPLKASVLACFAYPFEENININDSYLMSDGI